MTSLPSWCLMVATSRPRLTQKRRGESKSLLIFINGAVGLLNCLCFLLVGDVSPTLPKGRSCSEKARGPRQSTAFRKVWMCLMKWHLLLLRYMYTKNELESFLSLFCLCSPPPSLFLFPPSPPRLSLSRSLSSLSGMS